MSSNKLVRMVIREAVAATTTEEKPDTGGIALASGFSRVLQRLAEAPPVKEESGNYVVSKMKPFAVLTAFKGDFTHKQNVQRNVQLEHDIQMKAAETNTKLGFYKLLGHFFEITKEGRDENLSYDDAKKQNKTMKVLEESLLVVKPDDMEFSVFENALHELGNKYNQDSVLFCDGEKIYFLEKSGNRIPLGANTMNVGRYEQFYSTMRKKNRVPFVFAAVQQPVSVFGALNADARGRLRFALTEISREEASASQEWSEATNADRV